MKRFSFFPLTSAFASAIVILLTVLGIAQATTMHTPVAPSWAGGSNVTSQFWNVMVPGANVPGPTTATAVAAQTYTNANGQPTWYDSTAPTAPTFADGDGSFNAGGDAYSFSGILSPVANVPSSNIAGNLLNVFIETQSFGSDIDVSNLTATFTDPGGNVHSALVSTFANYQTSEAYNDGGTPFPPFGTASLIDNVWQFTLPTDTANLQLSWGWGFTSAAFQDLTIFTQSVNPSVGQATPEPGSLALAGIGAIGIVAMRYRNGRWKKARRPLQRSTSRGKPVRPECKTA